MNKDQMKPHFLKTIKDKQVEMLDTEPDASLWLQCKQCGQQWSPSIQPGGRMAKNYWACPNKCNWRTQLKP